ncbi:hypothetical protein [Micromonospora gifhornensis]|uniref:hypothetical protein n=1 Tax=Micromonospora gifhornensis TaxID=84594 RepID=UPI003D751A27
MSTDISTFAVETRALVAFGVERYEDATCYSAIRRYLTDIGSIPRSAWGTLDGVSDKLGRDWAAALDSRVREANTARDEMDRMADGLLQIAADYEGTDLHVSTSFDVVNRDLLPYLPLADGYGNPIRVRPGGAGILAPPHHRMQPGDAPVLTIPDDNDRLTATRNEALPHTRVVEEPLRIHSNFALSGGRTTYYENGGGDHLDTFINEHRSTLLQLEALLIELGTGERLPLSDLMIHAWRSAPPIIRNRADLIHSVANTYGELRAEMAGELANLKLYWECTAAQAFTHYADRAITYLTQLEAQARWLADEGKRAASMLEGLRNAYASLGYEQISILITALNTYLDAINSPFAACTHPEKAFLDVVNTFIGYLRDAEKRHVDAMASLIKVDEQERKERPDLGTRSHDTTPFPHAQVGAGAWTDRNAWKPRPDRPII